MKTAALLALVPFVAGHGAIIAATGDAGGTGMALGVDSATPRDGTRRDPFQQDSTRFKGANAATVGQTLGGGENDLESGTQAIMAETGDQLPQVTPGGQVKLTVHQVNGDGAGPYECMVNADGTAQQWTNIQVTTNVPGQNGRNRRLTACIYRTVPPPTSPLNAAIPAGQSCTGTVAGQENVCLVRCQNPANAGPFGGVIPVQMAGANNTAAAARRALAEVVRRNTLAIKARKAKRDEAEEAAALGMSVEDLEALREDGEEI
ncbi:hypothetical protein N0V93_007209 [Gnomoniopsis smithogilvyi]|uniref:Uncharacterized protein n=1 Tax=Gnomoniopsis smithogilvyi TaxID=1191159 RepID=A0A9W9CWF8_9PEZI|nr:hypothetical protein N0V93_007209 [Gnomoniopsis smithogilvyi]